MLPRRMPFLQREQRSLLQVLPSLLPLVLLLRLLYPTGRLCR
jgi:hypothetical protein